MLRHCSSLYRARRGLVRGRVRTLSLRGLPASAPVLSAQIFPLFVPLIEDIRQRVPESTNYFRMSTGKSPVNFVWQAEVTRKLSFCDVDDFPEVEDRHAFDRLYWAWLAMPEQRPSDIPALFSATSVMDEMAATHARPRSLCALYHCRTNCVPFRMLFWMDTFHT